ncbi:MAG: chromate transporter [Yoonia sp.]
MLPGALIIAVLALTYGAFGNPPVALTLFLEVKAAIVIRVIRALIKIDKRALIKPSHKRLAMAAFFALFVFALPFPLVIFFAALFGALGTSAPDATTPLPTGSIRKSVAILRIGGLLWAAPIVIVALSDNPFLIEVGIFFSTLAAVTFGGAYAVLAYVIQEVVVTFSRP